MPEGDTIHKVVAVLRPALLGERVVRLWTRDRGEIAGLEDAPVQDVEAVGKHMLVTFGATSRVREPWVLRVHLGMHGSWHRYPPSDRPVAVTDWKSVVLTTARDELVCYRAAQVDLRRASDPVLRHKLERIGPDLASETCDMDEVMRCVRAPQHAGREIADALLDQSIAAGIGNVYKSEILFIDRVHPQTHVGSLDEATLLRLFTRARALLRSNLVAGPRSTVGTLRGRQRRADTSRLWVYRRARLPCLRCNAFIVRAVQGEMARSTYWCPRCQRPVDEG